jgi:hypothetical protein
MELRPKRQKRQKNLIPIRIARDSACNRRRNQQQFRQVRQRNAVMEATASVSIEVGRVHTMGELQIG